MYLQRYKKANRPSLLAVFHQLQRPFFVITSKQSTGDFWSLLETLKVKSCSIKLSSKAAPLEHFFLLIGAISPMLHDGVRFDIYIF